MAAPVAAVRQAPDGIMLENGYQSLITLSHIPDLEIWEVSVTPPGVEGGEPIDQTTMHNVTYKTKAAQALVDLTASQFVAAYDPAFYSRLSSGELINVPCTVTQTFSDGSTLAYYGYAKSLIPGELVDGQQPRLTGMIVPTNWDYVNKVEAGPTLVSVAGT